MAVRVLLGEGQIYVLNNSNYAYMDWNVNYLPILHLSPNTQPCSLLCIFSTDCMKKAANSLVGGVLSVVWNRRSQYREQRYIAAYHRAYVLSMIAGNWRCAAA